jgi:hypothetical protein
MGYKKDSRSKNKQLERSRRSEDLSPEAEE